MPAYSFKERFVPMVKDGSKSQTIRSFRKYPVTEDQQAHLYYGMRTKFCSKLVEPSPKITSVSCVLFTADFKIIIIHTNWIEEKNREFFMNEKFVERYLIGRQHNNVPAFLNGIEWEVIEGYKDLDHFAWLDGFRRNEDPKNENGCYELMMRFWGATHQLPFLGNLIKWI